MPAIQDIYSVNVSNRYDIGSEPDDESDTAADYDPLDTLKTLEDQKKQSLEEAKKKKQALANRSKNQKNKPTRFQENKDANVPPKKEGGAPKSAKGARQQNERSDGQRQNSARRPRNERPNYGEGDENRRPPRRRNDPPRENNENQKTEGGLDQSRGDKLRHPGGPGDFNAPRRDRAERYRGGRGGYRNNGGGYQGRNFGGGYRNDGRDDRGKREFDRRSGSDRSSVKPSDKRDGAGPRNWGTPGNEIEEAGEVNTTTEPVGTWQENPETEGTESPKKTEEGTVEESSEEKEPKEEEPTEMTLDEWKAQQGQDTQAKPSFNIRKPGEGENQDKWKGMKVLRKVNKADSKQESTTEEQHKRQMKQQVNVNIQFGDNSNRGFGGRGRGRGGGRGRGRGGRYGGDRMQRQGHQLLPDVQNEQEFPTLG